MPWPHDAVFLHVAVFQGSQFVADRETISSGDLRWVLRPKSTVSTFLPWIDICSQVLRSLDSFLDSRWMSVRRRALLGVHVRKRPEILIYEMGRKISGHLWDAVEPL